MNKFGTWVLNNLVIILGVVTLGVTAGVITGVMVNSYNSYKDYEKKFNQADLDIRSISPAQPKMIEFQDDFKSGYDNYLAISAKDLKVSTTQESFLTESGYIDLTEKGGTVSIELELKEKSFVDIDFVISSQYAYKDEDDNDAYGVKDLLNNVTFVVNGETMEEEEIDLVNSGSDPEFHHLIMAEFAFPAGPVKVEIKNNSGKVKMMPQIQEIGFYSLEKLSLPEPASAE